MSPTNGRPRHVVWDWNGTLFDDFPLILDSCNAALAALGGAPVDEEGYRSRFIRPVKAFYEDILGREVSDDDWIEIDQAFHDHYHARIDEAALRGSTLDALGVVEESGATQSLLSMWHHDQLLPFTFRLGISDRFQRIDGRRDEGGGSKAPYLRAHLAALAEEGTELDPGDVLMIGDTLDDAASAADVGTRAVLFTGGEHGPESLAQAGFPVAHDLIEALALGGLTTG